MIDHLLSFPSEAEAFAEPALAPWIIDTEDGPAWDLSRCFPSVSLITARPTRDANGDEITPQTKLPGWSMIIASREPAPRVELTALNAHRLCANREEAAAGRPFIYKDGLRADPALMAQVIAIDGAPARSDYPWDRPATISQLFSINKD